MATTTTNFGWDIPQSTDLVMDGATAIAALGQDIDTALVDLKGGTTGQVLAKASGTDLDFSWVAQDDSNAIQNAIVDAKGDLIGATAADTPARLAVGTNGQVLTADSTAATGLAWATIAAGGWTSIASGALGSSGTTISSIPGTYQQLVLVVTNYLPNTSSGFLAIQMNADTTANRHGTVQSSENLVGTSTAFNSTYMRVMSNNSNSTSQSLAQIVFPNYSNATTWKFCSFDSMATAQANTANYTQVSGSGVYNQTAAITSLGLVPSAGTITSGNYALYGVK